MPGVEKLLCLDGNCIKLPRAHELIGVPIGVLAFFIITAGIKYSSIAM